MASQYRWDRPIAELIREAESRWAETGAELAEARSKLHFHERWAGRGFDWYPAMMKAWREETESHGTPFEHFLPKTVAEYAKAYRETLMAHRAAKRDLEILRTYQSRQEHARSRRTQSEIDKSTRTAVRHTEERLRKRLAPTLNRAALEMQLGETDYDPAKDPAVVDVFVAELEASSEALAQPSEEGIGTALTVVAATMSAGVDQVATGAVARAMQAARAAAAHLRVEAERDVRLSPSREGIARVVGLSAVENALGSGGSDLGSARKVAEQLVSEASKAVDRDDSEINRLRLQKAETLLQLLGGS